MTEQLRINYMYCIILLIVFHIIYELYITFNKVSNTKTSQEKKIDIVQNKIYKEGITIINSSNNIITCSGAYFTNTYNDLYLLRKQDVLKKMPNEELEKKYMKQTVSFSYRLNAKSNNIQKFANNLQAKSLYLTLSIKKEKECEKYNLYIPLIKDKYTEIEYNGTDIYVNTKKIKIEPNWQLRMPMIKRGDIALYNEYIKDKDKDKDIDDDDDSMLDCNIVYTSPDIDMLGIGIIHGAIPTIYETILN